LYYLASPASASAFGDSRAASRSTSPAPPAGTFLQSLASPVPFVALGAGVRSYTTYATTTTTMSSNTDKNNNSIYSSTAGSTAAPAVGGRGPGVAVADWSAAASAGAGAGVAWPEGLARAPPPGARSAFGGPYERDAAGAAAAPPEGAPRLNLSGGGSPEQARARAGGFLASPPSDAQGASHQQQQQERSRPRAHLAPPSAVSANNQHTNHASASSSSPRNFSPSDSPVSTSSQSASASHTHTHSVAPCVVCLERPRETVLLECMHLCLCQRCADTFVARRMLCPMCLSRISRVLKVYI
jgi:hypothetical protein